MPKISRKIAQAVLRGGGKALTRLTNSRVGEELRRTSAWYQSPSAKLIGRISRSINPNAGYRMADSLYHLTGNLANKKIISPRRHKDLNNSINNVAHEFSSVAYEMQRVLNNALEPIYKTDKKKNALLDTGILKITEKLLDKKIITPRQAKTMLQVVQGPKDSRGKLRRIIDSPMAQPDSSLSQKTKKVKNLENYARLPYTRRVKLSNMLNQIESNYHTGRALARMIGNAGLLGAGIGAGVAGAKALAPKEEPKSNSSGVKKMANRSNKYFS